MAFLALNFSQGIGAVGLMLTAWIATSLLVGCWQAYKNRVPFMKATLYEGVCLWVALFIIVGSDWSCIHIWWLAPISFLIGMLIGL